MLPFDFSVDAIGRALNLAKEHAEQYYPYRVYDEGSFAIRSRLPPESIVEVTRKQLLNSKETALRTSGIYLIVHENGQTVYVGLAADYHGRFAKGIRKHSEECEPGCGHWGHFADPTTGAVLAGMPNGNCRYFILENIEHDGFGISQAEIDWYYLFIANGWSDNRLSENEDKKITNSRGSLGAKGAEVTPCVVCQISTGEHWYFPSQTSAQDYFQEFNEDWRKSIGARVIGVSIEGKQNQRSGFTARYATPEEIDSGSIVGESDVVWRIGKEGPIVPDLRDSCLGCEDQKNRHQMRTFSLTWNSGYLSELDLLHLLGTMQGSYEIPIVNTELNGISWLKSRKITDFSPRWQVRARRSSDSKDLFQTNRKEWTEENLLQAAIYREDKIRKEGWTEYNTGKYASNAAWINRELGKEKYAPW